MGLVGYSDSEDSDEDTKHAPIDGTIKRLARTQDKKIKVDLPALKAENNSEQVSEPTAKRQRTGGAFSGFNSLLPAPKRAASSAIKAGVSLRTSSEAAFSRVPAPQLAETENTTQAESETAEDSSNALPPPFKQDVASEPKLVGKTTRFLPLSVANAKKKKRSSIIAAPTVKAVSTNTVASEEVQSAPQPKRSLFSMEEAQTSTDNSTTPYVPEFLTLDDTSQSAVADLNHVHEETALQGVASDLNLSDADRRRLFGRHGNQGDVKIAHFDLNSEYKSNQEMAARGELVEHKTVRAIAPGRHSLQQLMNNVRGQTEAIEDKWAEGRRNRGETASKYGW